MKASKLILLTPLFFLMACSAAYEQVKEMDVKNPKTFQQHLLYNYKNNASFEAEKMHDWNSAKLYSEKALRAFDGENIYLKPADDKIFAVVEFKGSQHKITKDDTVIICIYIYTVYI